MPRGKPTQAQSRWGFVPSYVPAPFDRLTFRERQVAWHLAHGLYPRQIAELCSTSTKTIDTHRLHVMRKVGVTNTVILARLAIRVGFVTAHEVDGCDCRKITTNEPAELATDGDPFGMEHHA